MSKKVKVLIITGVGLNCEMETETAFEYAGAVPELVHLNDLLNGEKQLDKFHILAFIGGFSYGDHLGAGTVFANKLKFRLRDQIENFINEGKLIIGICNGFQTLTRLGLLPATNGNYFVQQVALAPNDSGVFRDDWVYLNVNKKSPCIFTRGIERLFLPIRHGEGKFVAEEEIIEQLKKNNLVTLYYTNKNGIITDEFPYNPNGSVENIAGICDPSGRIFGLMPHPEAYLSPYNSPYWPREIIDNSLPKEGLGVKIFKNAVEYINGAT